MSFAIRRLTRADAADYKAIRLEALRDEPDAFLDSFEEASERPETYWTTMFDGERAFFGADSGGRLVGTANYYRRSEAKLAHKSWLFGMFVRKEARGTGCARALVDTVIDHAKEDGAAQLHLGVSANNAPAKRLYEKAGFSAYGTEPRGMRIGDMFIDEILMVKMLDGG